MKFRIEKNGQNINFIDCETNSKFDYITFADNLYQGKKLEIEDYGGLSKDEITIVKQTVNELNSLSNPRKRRKIITQLDNGK